MIAKTTATGVREGRGRYEGRNPPHASSTPVGLLFDLGERGKVVLLSVAEGDDEPDKYPHMFRAAEAMVVTKLDLSPHVRLDLAGCIAAARALDPALVVLTVSAVTGDGLDGWLAEQAAPISPAPAVAGTARPTT